MEGNTEGENNTAIGWRSLKNVTTTGLNTAIGYRSLNANTAQGNTAIGAEALYSPLLLTTQINLM